MKMKTHYRNKRKDNYGIDRRRAYYIVLDTETCNGIMTDKGLNLDDSLVYDIGFAVVDKHGRIYETRSYVIYETFFGMADIMKSAYYANKIENYLEDIANRERKIVQFKTAMNELRYLAQIYKVKAIMAHNARFDYRSCNNTLRYLTKSDKRFFFPYGIEIWDTLAMARSIYGKSPSYKKWCIQNGYMTKNNQVRLTAEILYRYITGKSDFVESHTGLEDVLIEKEIFRKCMAWHKPMEKRLFKN
jgi:DNA polymerase III epsilon subunit-like protein